MTYTHRIWARLCPIAGPITSVLCVQGISDKRSDSGSIERRTEVDLRPLIESTIAQGPRGESEGVDDRLNRLPLSDHPIGQRAPIDW